MAAAFTVHPYGRPVVGYMSDIQRLRRPDVEAYFRSYYGPRNAVVTVVGDIDPDQILAWADEYFEDLPAGEIPEPVLLREPGQSEERRVEVTLDVSTQVRIGWPVVETADPDAAALTVLSRLLTGGLTSRLHRRLVIEDQVATGVTSSMGRRAASASAMRATRSSATGTVLLSPLPPAGPTRTGTAGCRGAGAGRRRRRRCPGRWTWRNASTTRRRPR